MTYVGPESRDELAGRPGALLSEGQSARTPGYAKEALRLAGLSRPTAAVMRPRWRRRPPRPVSDQVVVITGASSGIGRCTALYLAACGARVVVTARRAAALGALVREVEAAGGEALAVPGDVTKKDDLRTVARRAVERFGRIDTWVNDAGVYLQGRVQDITLDEYRRLLDVDLVGVINGTQCALEVMLEQGFGVVVQVSSVSGKRAVPLTSAYSAAKAGIDGFSDALRSELSGTGIRISVLYPPPVDTPIYHSARGKLGVVPKPVPPIADPIEAARAIAHLAGTGDRSRFFGWAGPLNRLNQLSPALGDWLLHHGVGFTLSDLPARSGDNLYHPSTTVPPTIRAGWARAGWKGLTLRETARVLPVETILLALAAGVLAGRAAAGIGRGR